MIELISLPFMQRAILGGVIISILASLVGVLVVLKKSSFFGDTIAHASLTGVALALLVGLDPIIGATIVVLTVAVVLPILEKNSNLPSDNLLGFILPFSMAIGIVILTFLPGYQPELISYLFGNILTISWNALLLISITALVVLAVFLPLMKQLTLTVFDPDQAKLSNINTSATNLIYSILVALTIVASIKMVGIVLVNALLVIPATTVRLHARSLKDMFLFTPIVALTATLAGLLLSYFANLPSGPSITLIAGLFLLLSIGYRKLK